ncbi:3-coathanger stack domain-containing protein [Emticicia sp. SJ17W-69]|uniref:3-coathanger stack domain-containing protein n=1 Tax=Emticicia sp. SJ17W-69 TaxID=3421657 RepID=UPI003EBCA405
MKKHIHYAFLIIFLSLLSSKVQSQNIYLGSEIFSTCVDSIKTVSTTIEGEFANDNQFFIEFYSIDGSNRLVYSQAVQVVNKKISFTYPMSVYQYHNYVTVKMRSTNPANTRYVGDLPIYSKPSYAYLYEQKTAIESGIFNKNDIVELPFRIYTNTDVNIETTSGMKLLSAGGGGTRIYSYREIMNTTGVYGIKKASNFCGTTNILFGYSLKVNSERFKLHKTEQTEYVCTGNKFVVDLQTDNTLPETGISFLVDLTNTNGQSSGLNFSRNKQQLIIDIPEYQQAGDYTLQVRVVESELLATIPIKIKDTPTYSITGTYDVKYGESFLITGFNAPFQNNFNYEYLNLYLNSKVKLEINQQRELKYNFPKESGMYYLSGAFSADLSTSCVSKMTGGIQVNVKPSIKIESISNEVLCRGQDFILKLSSNQVLSSSYNYKVRLGKYATTESFSNRKYYYSTFEELNATWVSENTIKFTVPVNATLNTKPAYYISVVIDNPNTEGIIYPNPIRILEPPNVSFVNSTYVISPTSYVANYTTNSHIGWVEMSDGRTYPLEENIETGRENVGFIRSMAYQSGTYFPIKSWNQCGNGTVAGSYNVSNTNPSGVAILFAPLKKKYYCVGDTIWLDWIKNGVFNANNKFFIEFSEPYIPSIEISANQRFIISTLSSVINSPLIRIKSTSPEIYSLWRDLGVQEKPILANISMKNVQYGAYNVSFDTVTVNSYSPVVFYGHGGTFKNTSNQIIPLDVPISFTKDTVITIAQVSNGCVNQVFNKTLKINYRPYLCYVNDIQASCNKGKTLIRLKYFFYGDYSLPINLAVQFSNPGSGTWTTLTTKAQYSDEIWAELNSASVNGTYCYIRLVKIDEQNRVTDILSRNFTELIKKYEENYRLTTSLGNNVSAATYPFYLTLTTTPESPNFFYNFYNPYGILNQTMTLYKDEVFTVTNAYSDCGFVNVTDTVKVKFVPQLISTHINTPPCKNNQNPLSFTYEVLNSFPVGTVIKFYIFNSTNKYYIGQVNQLDGWFSTILPINIPLGTYSLGYESADGVFTKTIYWGLEYGDTGKARIISGTIDKYYNDPFYVPFELKDGYNFYDITLNISDYISFPVYDYRKITINEDGFKLGSLVSNQAPSEVFITSLRTLAGSCSNQILEGKLKVNYLTGYSNRIYANININNGNLPIKCVGAETLPVSLTSQGYFYPDNQFIPQLSDSTGLNFTDLAYTQSGNNFTIILPENLPTGEGYRIRFRSTSPVEYGASSVSNIVVKARPNVHLLGSYRINEGETVTLNANLTGVPPFNITYNNGQTIINLLNNSLQTVFTPVQDFSYSISSIRDKFCVGSSSGSLNVTLNCPQIKQFSLIHNENRIFKAYEIRSNARIDQNINIRYKGGKSILLEPGFKVENNAVFTAEMNGCN